MAVLRLSAGNPSREFRGINGLSRLWNGRGGRSCIEQFQRHFQSDTQGKANRELRVLQQGMNRVGCPLRNQGSKNPSQKRKEDADTPHCMTVTP